jgi:hypothetical protein
MGKRPQRHRATSVDRDGGARWASRRSDTHHSNPVTALEFLATPSSRGEFKYSLTVTQSSTRRSHFGSRKALTSQFLMALTMALTAANSATGVPYATSSSVLTSRRGLGRVAVVAPLGGLRPLPVVARNKLKRQALLQASTSRKTWTPLTGIAIALYSLLIFLFCEVSW